MTSPPPRDIGGGEGQEGGEENRPAPCRPGASQDAAGLPALALDGPLTLPLDPDPAQQRQPTGELDRLRGWPACRVATPAEARHVIGNLERHLRPLKTKL